MVNNNGQMTMLEIDSGHHGDGDFTQSFFHRTMKQTLSTKSAAYHLIALKLGDSVDSGQNSLPNTIHLFLDCPSDCDQRSWSRRP
ncbi:hypothetical protein T12_2523 [Trichinella patagoniensis]|uniref:Uncharacterized protein n=1 Tax=Trichinella patagoniensis TaxID=990121 RepID=A0A0V0ZG41_9BILA|nr:hypothetical protein T12_2523 [Trichinella patagoniensis]